MVIQTTKKNTTHYWSAGKAAGRASELFCISFVTPDMSFKRFSILRF